MPRIDTTDPHAKWAYACPSPERHRDWRVVDGHFQCRSCQQLYDNLIDVATGDRVAREEFEFVGSQAQKEVFSGPV